MTPALNFRVRSVTLFERPVTLRLPFRFGAATVTRCPQAFTRVEVEIGGRTHVGVSAELMVPKWFDKAPQLTHEQNFEQLRESLRNARSAYLAEGNTVTAFALSESAGEIALNTSVARGLPRLAAQFGPALLDKTIADAVLRAAGMGWVDGVAAGVLGDPWGPKLALVKAQTVTLRHTVGMADLLTDDEPGNKPDDGLPATLQSAIRHYELTHFKLKLSGQFDADRERLSRIASVLDQDAGDYRATLDGNETFTEAAALGEYWQRLTAEPALAGLLARTLLLEQPLARRVALEQSIVPLGIKVPVILDESDDHPDVLERGLALGYRGISSKACKGIYRSLHSAARIAQQPDQLILSGEDLTCQAGLAVQQDTLLAASLGVTHIERNGHHYVDGFGIAPADEARAFAKAHPGLYQTSDTNANARPHLAVRAGQLDLSSLHGPGFASNAQPLWDSLTPIS